MLVSWNWLKDYVPIKAPSDEVENRLMMAGINHESTEPIGDDLLIDLEVTSNRADCLGHLGIAREIAVLFDLPLKKPLANIRESGRPAADLVSVSIECPNLCPRYSARIVRGVKIGASPSWLARRLQTIGIALVNNVVDITNYVLMEAGQPLHAFDLNKLRGRTIVVREPRSGERLEAIDHRVYDLAPGMCVIADAEHPVALGGVMGGAETEVSSGTTDLLIEAADFSPLSIRGTARKLNLHSPSSYRFERGVDPQGLEWASRRCCELILEIAGGELAPGVVVAGREAAKPEPIRLRFSQLPRILGIEIGSAEVERILAALGLSRHASDSESISVLPPSWRADLTREVDLIEEVARVHGYDQIPENAAVPMVATHRRHEDRILETIRQVLLSCGFDEALTTSVVQAELSATYSPWTDQPSLQCGLPLLKGADQLRRCLLPSLFEARRINESLSNPECELFETARVYLRRSQANQLPHEQWTLGMVSGRGFSDLKGVVEALLRALKITEPIEVQRGDANSKSKLFDASRSCEILLAGQTLGFLGELSDAGAKRFGLREAASGCELSIERLIPLARHSVTFAAQSPFPSIARDLNLILDETVRWADLSAEITRASGPTLESLRYQETYRNPAKDGARKKRLLFTLTLRSSERTLTNEEADAIRDAVVRACESAFGARLLA